MSRHVVPASEKSGRPEVEFFTTAVDRKRRRVMIEVPPYNARFIFTETPEGVRIIDSDHDRQAIDSEQEVTDHVHDGVYARMAQVAASILNAKRR